MASTLGHSVAAFALGRKYKAKGFSFLFWALTLLSANIPDADVFSFRDSLQQSIRTQRVYALYLFCFRMEPADGLDNA